MPKILVVDDSETLRSQLRHSLESVGHQVVEAENGLIGLSMLEKHADTALILCDVNMPEMDGLSMCQKVHKDEKTNKIPIFMLTTESGSDLKSKGKEVGVKAWITKPYNEEKLLAVVKKVLNV